MEGYFGGSKTSPLIEQLTPNPCVPLGGITAKAWRRSDSIIRARILEHPLLGGAGGGLFYTPGLVVNLPGASLEISEDFQANKQKDTEDLDVESVVALF